MGSAWRKWKFLRVKIKGGPPEGQVGSVDSKPILKAIRLTQRPIENENITSGLIHL